MNDPKLSDIVNELLVEAGDSTTHRYPQFYQLGVACLRQQNLDMTFGTKQVSIKPNDNDVIVLPEDYIDYYMIGLCNNAGEIETMGYNSKLCAPKFDDCGNVENTKKIPARNEIANFIVNHPSIHIRNGEMIGRFFGIGDGRNENGFYGDVDRASGTMRLQSFAGDEVELVYKANLQISDDGDIIVHAFLRETVKSYIMWMKEMRRSGRTAVSQQDFLKKEYLRNRKSAQKKFAGFTIEELKMSYKKNQRMTPNL